MKTYPTIERPPLQFSTPLGNWLNRAYVSLANCVSGKVNALLELTLTANSATTDIIDPRLTGSSYLGFCPLTADAAAELPTLYVSAQDAQTATLTHTNAASTDRTYHMLIIG